MMKWPTSTPVATRYIRSRPRCKRDRTWRSPATLLQHFRIDVDQHPERAQLLLDPHVAGAQPLLVQLHDVGAREVDPTADLRQYVDEAREVVGELAVHLGQGA